MSLLFLWQLDRRSVCVLSSFECLSVFCDAVSQIVQRHCTVTQSITYVLMNGKGVVNM